MEDKNYYQMGYDYFDGHKAMWVYTNDEDFVKLNVPLKNPNNKLSSIEWQDFHSGFCQARQDFTQPDREAFYRELEEFNKRLGVNLWVPEEGVTKTIDGVSYDIS
jgi:hypothetical protein